jgi:hypothetical protein
MPPPIPLPLRQQIWTRHQQGQDATTIAHALRLCPRTVQHLVQRLRRRGAAGLQTIYHAPAPSAGVPEHVRHEAVFLHQEHPTWGAGFIRVRLRARHPSVPLPSERTLQRWLERTRAPAAPPGRKPAREHQRARGPHAVWQVDASEHIRLANGETVSWLRSVDEFTGAVLGTRVFSPRAVESSTGLRHPAVFAATVSPLGPARGAAGGQRHAVGQLERLTRGLGPVVDRPGRPRVLE